MFEIEVRMLSVISIICELQLWATGIKKLSRFFQHKSNYCPLGCPFGYLPTFDSTQGALYRSCATTAECMSSGAECKWSPVTATSVCCKTNPTFFSPLEEIIYICAITMTNVAIFISKVLLFIDPYIGYQEPFNVTDIITRPTTAVSTTTIPTTTTRTTTIASTTVSRIVNVTATASGSVPTTRMASKLSVSFIISSNNIHQHRLISHTVLK